MKLVAMIQVYNEVANGNLERCLDSVSNYCDGIQVFDDGSTDEPGTLYEKYKCDVIYSSSNDFTNELSHKQVQLDRCKELGADWIWRIDADEVIERIGETGGIRAHCENTEHDSWAFHMVNLWRAPMFYRVDNSFNDVVFNRLWRVPPSGLHFKVVAGLHQTNYPIGATDNEGFSDLEVLHYGFASDQAIVDKYNMYKSHGQTGPALNRLVDESTLRVQRSRVSWFKNGLSAANINKVFKTPISTKV
ncbi:hypothetical protein E4G67_00215 [Candidatus Bathyarchaeota archaeon]|nr:MAG: hypothetical protein E4G67_00215 [Candidatus Bathyarchaeota archaeon]